MFHQLRTGRKAVLTAARRKKYAKCDTLQCTGTWADPTGMIFSSMLGFFWQWHHIWNLCIRTGDSDTPSGVLIIAHPASSWSGGFPLNAQPTCWPVVFDMIPPQLKTKWIWIWRIWVKMIKSPLPEKKKNITCVAPLLPKFDPQITVLWCHLNPSQQGPRQAETGQILWNVAGDALYLAINLSRPRSETPPKKPRENHPQFEPESNWLMPKKTF